MLRATDRDMPRATEVLEALAARRGPVALSPDESVVLIGRLISLLVTGGQSLIGAPIPAAALAHHMAATARDLLVGILHLQPDEVEPIIRRMIEDFRDVDRRSRSS